jgi:serine/threonine protein kinase
MERLVEIDIQAAENHIPDVEKAIASIHRRGIVHHDISPSNIMLNQEGLITIIDFGRAGYAGEEIPPHKTIGNEPTTNVFSVNLH